MMTSSQRRAAGSGTAPQLDVEPLALYVHIPFCETKCPYCDFNTYAGIEALMPAYVDALAHEITQWGALLDHSTLGSVFFGGGTPSYLPSNDLTRLMRAIAEAFRLKDDAEVSLEANSGDLTQARARAMRSAGFNRVSVGVQSLDDQELRLLGRRHTAEQAIRAVAAARRAGFDNLSLDLMFGLPHQSEESWKRTLEGALRSGANHVSLYALTLEPGTPLEADVRAGHTPEPDPDLAADMYLHAQGVLASVGYQQYEISNWARPGHASRHNLTYWRNRPYLGVGPGAHSYLFANGAPELDGVGRHGARFASIPSPRGYMGRVAKWQAPQGPLAEHALRSAGFLTSVDLLDDAQAMGETMMMGLRLNAGVSNDEFHSRFGRSIAEAFPQAVDECLQLELLEWYDDSLRLTEYGRLLGNEAFHRFLATPT